jgi:hypothetical protein
LIAFLGESASLGCPEFWGYLDAHKEEKINVIFLIFRKYDLNSL